MHSEPLNTRKIFLFWYPLAATWLMMAVEGPFLTAIIARLSEPKFNLAAFGVAYSLALIAEAPIIMLLSASTALVTDRDAYFKLRRFTTVLNVGITLVILLILIPPVFNFIVKDIIGLPPPVVRLTHFSLLLLIPWPASIGFRRFYQGILIRFNLTRRVAYGTIVRLTAMAVTAIVLYLSKVPGASVGGGALAAGVVCECIASRFMAHSSIKRLLQEDNVQPRETPLSYRFITKFYYPLALMSLLSLGVHPLVSFFVGKSRFALESLAVLPVINSLVFIFRSPGISYLEAVVALMGKRKQHYLELRHFAWILGAAVVGGLMIIAFTPLAPLWFHQVSGLSKELASFSYLPTQIMTVLPGLTVFISFQRGCLVSSTNTTPITWATIIEVGTIIGVLFISIRCLDFIGAAAVACAFTMGLLLSNLYLFVYRSRKA